MKEIVVIGGGASGLISAICSKNENNNVTILERYEKCGRKILVSGNGRCNYWNSNQDIGHYHSSNFDFIKNVITNENKNATLMFLESLGIEPFIKNGYYYPYSMQSVTIYNILIREIRRKKINIKYLRDVKSIEKEGDKFKIIFNDSFLTADKVIMATGSRAYYNEENNGYMICKKLGHNIIETNPSLVQLVSDDKYFKDVKGIRVNVLVKILINDKVIKEEEGELLFTDYGLSGICIFNLSRIASLNLKQGNKVEISINFIHNFVDNYLEERGNKIRHDNLIELLDGILNEKLIKVIVEKANVDINKKYDNLNLDEQKRLLKNLIDFRVNINNTKTFKEAQTSIGGVDTFEINPDTMESKLVKNLYFVGEMMDVDGDCGGYNLSFSWISGMIAGRSVRND